MTHSITAPQRRTQEERSALTRTRLIEAAIEALYRLGYAATSTTLVAEQAGVSRGAMLHQFPAKVDLMAACVRATFEADMAAYQTALAPVVDPLDKILTVTETAFGRFVAPGGVAQTEIWMATRSDPDLADAVRPIYAAMVKRSEVGLSRLLSQAGVSDQHTVAALRTYSVAALRGLSLELALGGAALEHRNAFAMHLASLRTLILSAQRNT